MKPTPPNRPEQTQLHPRKPKIHRIFVNVSSYTAIDRNKNLVYRINPLDKLVNLVAGDLLVFEKMDDFTKKGTKKIKSFVITAVNHSTLNLVPIVSSSTDD